MQPALYLRCIGRGYVEAFLFPCVNYRVRPSGLELVADAHEDTLSQHDTLQLGNIRGLQLLGVGQDALKLLRQAEALVL